MLPNIRFRVDNTHVGLVSAPVYHHAAINLQDAVSCVVLGYVIGGEQQECNRTYWGLLTCEGTLRHWYYE